MITLLPLVVVSCKKKDEEPSRAALLQGGWTYSFYAIDKNKNQVLDADERVDNTGPTFTMTLQPDGNLLMRTSSVPSKNVGTWALVDNGRRIAFTQDFESDTETIYALTEKELILESPSFYSPTWSGYKK